MDNHHKRMSQKQMANINDIDTIASGGQYRSKRLVSNKLINIKELVVSDTKLSKLIITNVHIYK